MSADDRLSANFQNIKGMIGCAGQILPLARCEVIFHPFRKRFLIHFVNTFAEGMSCAVCCDQIFNLSML